MSINEKNFFLKNKKINVSNSSSLVNLKAELLKKKNDVSNLKINKEEFAKINCKNVSNTKWNQKAIQLDQKIRESIKNQKLSQIKTDEDDNLEKELIKSRLNLEKKAKEYEAKIKNAFKSLKNKDEVEENQNDLIDFERKVLDSSRNNLKNFIEKEDKEDLVEYLDSFGRTRFCKKSDLKKVDELNDQELLRRKLGSNLNELNTSLYDNFVQAKNDEEEDVLKKESHYQNVSKNEIREHGTSYYQFSTEEEERKKQMENLDSLRQQTIKQRKKVDNIREKKNDLLKQKLLNLAKRKGLIDQNLSENEASEIISLNNYLKNDKEEEDKDEIDTQEYINEKYTKNEKKLREWDSDKVYDKEKDMYVIDKKGSYDKEDFNSYSEDKSYNEKKYDLDLDKEYYKKRREERNEEFAPPEIYSNKNSKKIKKEINSDKIESKIDDFLKFSMNNSKF